MSDTLIATVKWLAEREKMNRPVLPLELRDDWYLYDDQLSILDAMMPCESNKLMVDLRNAAPRLLDVLCQFQAGDAAQIATIMRQMQSWYGEDRTPGYEERMKLLARMRNMASLMEAQHEI